MQEPLPDVVVEVFHISHHIQRNEDPGEAFLGFDFTVLYDSDFNAHERIGNLDVVQFVVNDRGVNCVGNVLPQRHLDIVPVNAAVITRLTQGFLIRAGLTVLVLAPMLNDDAVITEVALHSPHDPSFSLE